MECFNTLPHPALSVCWEGNPDSHVPFHIALAVLAQVDRIVPLGGWSGNMSDLGRRAARVQRELQELWDLILASQGADKYRRTLESLAALTSAIDEELLRKISLSVRGVSGDMITSVDIEPITKLANLKRAVFEPLAVGPRVRLSLVLEDRELRKPLDDLSLVECGIEDGATLLVIKQPIVQVQTASYDGTAKIWSASTGECLQTLSGHDDAV